MNLNIDRKYFFERGGIIDKLLDSTFDMALIVDRDKRIIFFSRSSESVTGNKAEDVVGKDIEEVVSGTPFENVLKTGVSDKGVVTKMDDALGIASHIPVFDGDELLGAIGIVYFGSISAMKRILAEMPSLDDESYSDIYNNIARQFSPYTFDDYIGESDAVKELIEKAKRAAESKLPILFIGETGTGKEILASGVHNYNKRTFTNPFVKINCSAIPGNLLESELFGHEKGAFTGAAAMKKGKFEVANFGSILLDEIGDMDINMQTKLLRVLEEKEFERVGGNRLLPTNARVIASTNKNLMDLCRRKEFREDLYYRLNTLEIYVPPLRERVSDIPLLIEWFIENKKIDVGFSDDAMDVIVRYSWPGNVRQLRNMMNRFGVMNRGEVISSNEVRKVLFGKGIADEMPYSDDSGKKLLDESSSGKEDGNGSDDRVKTMEEIEADAIRSALEFHKGNRSKAAASLAIARSTLNRKIKQYGIE
jgi:transcriptional regulator with PAS, ATPase and Fis domain